MLGEEELEDRHQVGLAAALDGAGQEGAAQPAGHLQGHPPLGLGPLGLGDALLLGPLGRTAALVAPQAKRADGAGMAGRRDQGARPATEGLT